MNKSFYEARNEEEAIELYQRGERELYAQIRNNLIKKILNKFFGEGNWENLKILEVGAGGGNWTEFFLGKKTQVTSIDINPLILKANAKRNPQARFILGDASKIQLNEKFDFVFAKDVIEHIKDDEKFLLNMNYHLKEFGIIMIVTQNSWSLNYLIQGGYHFIKGNKEWKGWDSTHVRFYNWASLKKKLKKARFHPLKWFGSYYFPYRIIADKFRVSENFLKIFCLPEIFGLSDKFLINILGWTIGVVAKKIK